MEKYLVDLFAESAQEQKRAPGWAVRLYLSLFSPPLGKTLRLEMVKHLLHEYDFQGKRVLDVGCGVGDLSFILANSGAEVIGVELDPQKVCCANKIAQRWHLERLRFIAGDVMKLDQMELGQFDVICYLALLEHIRDDVALLRQLQSMLRPGGVLVLEVPSARHRTVPEVEVADGHMRPGYLFEDMPELLASAGFQVVQERTMDPLGLNYYWFVCSRLIASPKVRPWLFAALAPLFLTLIRLTSAYIKRPGAELCFLASKDSIKEGSAVVQPSSPKEPVMVMQ